MELGHEIACHGCAGSTTSTCAEATEREHIAHGTRHPERADRRRVAARLVHRPRQPEHAPPGRRPRRLRLRQRLLRRRPAVLDRRSRKPTARACRTWSCPYTLDTNDMRFARPQGFNTGDALLHLPARQLRRALRRRRRSAAEDAVDRHALPPARPARPVRRAAAFPRPRAGARPGLDRAPHRHRPPLDAGPPGPRRPGWPGSCVSGIPPPTSRKEPS